jgi:hypothetical protein
MAISILELCRARWAKTHGPPYSHVAAWVARAYPELAATYPELYGEPGKVINEAVFEDRGFYAVEIDEYDPVTREATLEVLGVEPRVTFKARDAAEAQASFRPIVDDLIAHGVQP